MRYVTANKLYGLTLPNVCLLCYSQRKYSLTNTLKMRNGMLNRFLISRTNGIRGNSFLTTWPPIVCQLTLLCLFVFIYFWIIVTLMVFKTLIGENKYNLKS